MDNTKQQPRIGSLRWRRQTAEWDELDQQQVKDAEEERLTQDEGSETDDR